MSQPYYDPNDPNQQGQYDPYQQGDVAPQGYVRVQPVKKGKVGDQYKGSGGKKKKKGGKTPPGQGAAMLQSIGFWIVGLGLPILLVYFGIQKLFVEKIEVQMEPYPAVQLSPEQKTELLKFGETIATELTEGTKDELQRRVIWPEITYRVSKKMELTMSQSIKVRDEVKARFEADIPGLFRQILGSELDRVPARFVKIRERDGFPCALIRTMPSEGLIYYYDILVVPVEQKLRVVDIWDCTRAMFASDTVRREVLRTLPTDDAHSLPWKSVYGANRTKEEILAISNLIANDALHRPQAIADIEALPAEVQNTSEMYSMKVKAYQKLMSGLINKAELEKFKTHLSTPPNLEQNSVVTGTLLAEIEKRLGNPAGVEQALLTAHKEIGGDAYLKVVIGEHLLAAGDVPGAEARANEAMLENRNVYELAPLKMAIEQKRSGK